MNLKQYNVQMNWIITLQLSADGHSESRNLTIMTGEDNVNLLNTRAPDVQIILSR